MIFDLFINSLAMRYLGGKIMRSECIAWIFFHECELAFYFMSKLNSYNVKRALGNALKMS